MAGQGSIRILPLRADVQIDARQVEVMLGESREILVGEIRAVTERDQPAVGQEMDAQLLGVVIFGQPEFAQSLDGALVDDADDVLLRPLADKALLGGEALDREVLVILPEVSRADFVEIEGDLVVPQISRERDAVAVGDFPADAGLPHGHGAVPGDELEEFVAPLDLELVQP